MNTDQTTIPTASAQATAFERMYAEAMRELEENDKTEQRLKTTIATLHTQLAQCDINGYVALKTRIDELETELQLIEQTLDRRTEVLQLIPECEVHGDLCLPHASVWIEQTKANERIYAANQEECDELTEEVVNLREARRQDKESYTRDLDTLTLDLDGVQTALSHVLNLYGDVNGGQCIVCNSTISNHANTCIAGQALANRPEDRPYKTLLIKLQQQLDAARPTDDGSLGIAFLQNELRVRVTQLDEQLELVEQLQREKAEAAKAHFHELSQLGFAMQAADEASARQTACIEELLQEVELHKASNASLLNASREVDNDLIAMYGDHVGSAFNKWRWTMNNMGRAGDNLLQKLERERNRADASDAENQQLNQALIRIADAVEAEHNPPAVLRAIMELDTAFRKSTRMHASAVEANENLTQEVTRLRHANQGYFQANNGVAALNAELITERAQLIRVVSLYVQQQIMAIHSIFSTGIPDPWGSMIAGALEGLIASIDSSVTPATFKLDAMSALFRGQTDPTTQEPAPAV